MRYRLQRHDGTDCSATMVPITVLRMVPIQRYRQQNAGYFFYTLISWLFLFPFDYFIVPIVKSIMLIIRTLTMFFYFCYFYWCQKLVSILEFITNGNRKVFVFH